MKSFILAFAKSEKYQQKLQLLVLFDIANDMEVMISSGFKWFTSENQLVKESSF